MLRVWRVGPSILARAYSDAGRRWRSWVGQPPCQACAGGPQRRVFQHAEQGAQPADLGANTFLLLKNHGLLTVGASVADAFLAMHAFEATCRIQFAAQSGGDALTEVGPAILRGTAEAMRVQTGGLGGAFVWPALLRKLDRMGSTHRE